MDGMYIKSGVVYSKSKGCYEGFANFGENIFAFDSDVVATEAIVFMLVGLRGHWKTPIGYVLCNSTNATNLHCLIAKALQLASSHDLCVHTITTDGLPANIDAMRSFGCQFGSVLKDIKGSFSYEGFPHPLFFSGDPQFVNAKGTIRFIRVIDQLFDLLNSRNAFGKGFKKPLFLHDTARWVSTIENSIKYLITLKSADGCLLVKHRRKTFVVGFIVALKSIHELSIKESAGSIFSLKWTRRRTPLIECNDFSDADMKYVEYLTESLENVSLCAYKEVILGYIAGYIVRKLSNKIHCAICNSAMFSNQTVDALADHGYTPFTGDRHLWLINSKNRGGLIIPASGVVNIVSVCEKIFRAAVCGVETKKQQISSRRNIKAVMIHTINQQLALECLFPELGKHDLEHEALTEDLHSTQLLKKIIEHFITLRLATYAKHYTRDEHHKDQVGVRQQSTKQEFIRYMQHIIVKVRIPCHDANSSQVKMVILWIRCVTTSWPVLLSLYLLKSLFTRIKSSGAGNSGLMICEPQPTHFETLVLATQLMDQLAYAGVVLTCCL
eukprot:gene4076-4630_t